MRMPYAPLLTAAALLGACGGGAVSTPPRADAASVTRDVDIDDTSLDFTDEAAGAAAMAEAGRAALEAA